MPRFARSSWFPAMFVLSLTAFIPAATAQSDPTCAVHLSDCHVDTRLEMAGIADTRQARIFLDRLKTTARTGDRNGLAALVKYPLDIRDGDRVKTYRSAAEVVRAFDAVFTRGVMNTIAAAEYESLFVNDSGAMIGDGEIWFDGWDGAVLIKAISPEVAASTGESGGMERIFRTQEALNSLGYDAGVSDGLMGPSTRKALAAFQRAQGLPVTSEIDDETIAALAAAREQGSAPQAAEGAGASPEETVRGIYSTLGLAPAEERQLMEVITAPAQRGRYFAPRLVALLDANDSDECIDFSLNVNGQDYDSTEIARTLKIDSTGDGDRMIVDATFTSFGGQNHFRYEFIRDGEDWKISDIASLEGFTWRLSDISCGPAEKGAPLSAQPPVAPADTSVTAPAATEAPRRSAPVISGSNGTPAALPALSDENASPEVARAHVDWPRTTLMLSQVWAKRAMEFIDKGERDKAIAAALKGLPADILRADLALFAPAHLALYSAVRSNDVRLPLGNRFVSWLYVSTDRSRAVTESRLDTGARALELWNTEAREPIAVLIEDLEDYYHFHQGSVAFSNDGRYLAVAGKRGSLLVFDPHDGSMIADLPAISPPHDDSPQSRGHPQFRSIGFNPASTMLVSAGSSPPELRVWRLPDLDLILARAEADYDHIGAPGAARSDVSARFANDTTLCVSLSKIVGGAEVTEHLVGLIDLAGTETYRRLNETLSRYGGGVAMNACSPDLRWMAVRYVDENHVDQLDILDLSSGRPPINFGHPLVVGDLVFNAESTVLGIQALERWEFIDLATGEKIDHHPGSLEGFVLRHPILISDSTGEQAAQDISSYGNYGAGKIWEAIPTGLDLIELAYARLDDETRAEVDADRVK